MARQEITLEFTKEHHRRDGMDSHYLLSCIMDGFFVLKNYYIEDIKQAKANIELKKLFEMKDSVGDCQVDDIITKYIYELGEFCRERDAEILKLREENKKIKEEYERWQKAQAYIEKQNDRITEDLGIEVYKLKQENEKMKKELDALKEFELDRILDASLNELF